MFERFTERAGRTLFFARHEALQFGFPSIEAEHILLGLVREGHGLMVRVFANWHLSLHEARQRVEARIEHRGTISRGVELPLSASAKRVLGFAREEADRLEHQDIGSRHLLVGLLRTDPSLPATLLKEAGMTLDAVRAVLARADSPEMSISLATIDLATLSDTVAHLQRENVELRERVEAIERELRGRTGS